MAAQTVTWWVFLALTQYASSNFTDLFEMESGSMSANEGSCIKIICRITADRDEWGAYWYWKKKAQRDGSTYHSGDTVIYSSNEEKSSISHEFKDRVNYLGSSSTWKSGGSCSVLICDLKTSDNGKYFLTYQGSVPRVSRDVPLTIKENPCPLSLNQSLDVIENEEVTLTCSTSTSCPSELQIQNVAGMRQQTSREGQKSTTVTFSPSRDDNEKVFTCQTQDNTDKYLIRTVKLSVLYAPVVEIKINSQSKKDEKGKTIILSDTGLDLTCNVVRSNPEPDSFTWTINGTMVGRGQAYTKSWLGRLDQGLYKCTATNKAGSESSQTQLDIQYRPRSTTFSVDGSSDNKVKVEQSVTFTCHTDANPAPTTYTWYRNQNHWPESWWKNTESSKLTFNIQRADASCYSCSAHNRIGTGERSSSVCVQVLYPPSQPQLNMPAEATKGRFITIRCSAESFPKPTLTLIAINSSNRRIFTTNQQPNSDAQPVNTLYHTLTVTPAHAGLYRCSAINSEGTTIGEQKLVVKYAPINVRVKADPGLTVKETQVLTLSCLAESYPPVSTVTWMKRTDGGDDIIQQNRTLSFTVNSASPSDSGLYSCEATNQIGSGKSQPAEVEVKYAPKNLNITGWVQRWESDGRSSVTLSCISQSFPPVHLYSWHRKIEGKENAEIVSRHQNYTVYSDQPGIYFCTAKNEVDQRSSEPVHLFEYTFWYNLRFIITGLLVLMIIIIIIFILRYRRKKYQQGTRNSFLFGYMRNGARRRSLTNELVPAEPFRSRDDLLSAQMSHPQVQRHQPLVDDTPQTNVNTVYSILNMSQEASAQKPKRQQAGHMEANSTASELSYASLHFWKRPKEVQTEALYAAVSKPKKLSHEERTQDYENVASKFPNLSDDDEGEVNYSQVTFAATPRRQVTDRDSTSSDEENIQYSDIRI